LLCFDSVNPINYGGYSIRKATRYRLDIPGMESRCKRDFSCRRDRPWGPPGLLYKG